MKGEILLLAKKSEDYFALNNRFNDHFAGTEPKQHFDIKSKRFSVPVPKPQHLYKPNSH